MIVLVVLEPNPPRAMPEFIEALEENSSYWRLLLRNAWVSHPTVSVQGLYGALKAQLGQNDKLFVTKITHDHAGWLDEKAVTWLKQAQKAGLF